MNNLDIYNKYRAVPTEAQKPIAGGRLKGMTDINPMWRLKSLTEQFGPVGQGWYYEIVDERIEEGGNEEKVAFVRINLYVKFGEEWSKPIQGTGGSSFIAKERNGLYTSDECFKMALTDAISVACKALGIGADVYFEKDRSKNDKADDPTEPNQNKKGNLSENQIKRLYAIGKSRDVDRTAIDKSVVTQYKKNDAKDLTKVEYDELCSRLEALPKA